MDDEDYCIWEKCKAKHRSSKVQVKVKGTKMKFGESDDAQLRELVKAFGCKDWDLISMKMGNRNPRQCRERWEHYLSPKVNNGPWTPEEDKIMLARYAELGSRWNAIAKYLKGRTNTCVKNRYLFLQRAKERKIKKSVREDVSMITDDFVQNPSSDQLLQTYYLAAITKDLDGCTSLDFNFDPFDLLIH